MVNVGSSLFRFIIAREMKIAGRTAFGAPAAAHLITVDFSFNHVMNGSSVVLRIEFQRDRAGLRLE